MVLLTTHPLLAPGCGRDEVHLRDLSVPARARHVLTFSRLQLHYFALLLVVKSRSVLLLWKTVTLDLHIKHKQLLLTLMNK